MSKATLKQVEFAPGKVISLETGRLARQAGGAVVARLGDTMVLCTAVATDYVREGQNFFPLTVDYREKFSSAGKIPGGFIKREGRPSDKEVLTSRLVDRAIRPLFPDGFFNEVQIICYVISADDENDADVLAGLAASAALMLTGAPFQGPIAEVRVGRVNDRFIINPTITELAESDFNLIVAGRKDAIVMVEGEMNEVSEDDVLEALDVAHDAIRLLCVAQDELVQEAGVPKPLEYTSVSVPATLVDRVRDLVAQRIDEHIRRPYSKDEFYGGISEIKDWTLDQLLGAENPEAGSSRADATDDGFTAGHIKQAVGVVEKEVMREMILSDQRRIDGRGLTEVRDIWSEVGYLPRVHGSAIFTRGETQVLASVTLGTKKDVQPVDQVFDTNDKRFYLHYNFPPFCTGEAKFLRGSTRREIGHGILAERALSRQLPSVEEFPYTVRLNADVLESNGSSSMASVCAGTLAMMDGGIPIRKPVSGIAMGLISDGSRTVILSDILGTEDHLGDMDFKVTGTRDGVTACQMDIKIDGLSRDIMRNALLQAREGRDHIMERMLETLPEARTDLSPHAPRLTQFTIDTDYIGAVIGPGGKIIQGLQRDTNTIIEIEERDGLGYVTVAATNSEDADKAINIIRSIASTPEAGQDYVGTVRNIQSFGAIVEIAPGKEGLLHISELDYGFVDNVEDYVAVGDEVTVRLVEVRDDGKLRLSRKPFLEKPEGYEEREQRPQRSGGGGRSGGGRNGERRGGGGRGRRDNRGGGNRN
ncbi:MAG: polyribonucleotide nucleotidyltransferase [Rhodothermales bacterium]|nr:polyribonucleotide nucleotidyltransferase [Rhodothermales bacterium]